MTKPRIVLSLCLLLTLLVIGTLFVEHRKKNTLDPTLFRNASHVEIAIQGVPVSLKKNADTWVVESYDGSPVKDVRANQNFITHLIDLAQNIRVSEARQYDASAAPQYGLTSPRLSLAVAWEAPQSGSEVVLFGNRDVSGRGTFAFFPKHELLLEVRASILDLIDGKTTLDIRDRRITTFEIDDIEDLATSQDCGDYSLWRDGDRWVWKSTNRPQRDVEKWLTDLLATRYEQIDEELKTSDRTLCTIELKGRANRSEKIVISAAQDSTTIWATNSQLPAAYRLPVVVTSLLPIKVEKKAVSPK